MLSHATKFFLDSASPLDTAKALSVLGFLDGQTTNPSLVAKNPEVIKKIESGKKLNETQLLDFYKQIVIDISSQIPEGSVSIEVYADKNTSKIEILKQAETMYQWISNAHIKFPTIPNGLEAAIDFAKIGGRVNMTLGFSLDQALAVALAFSKSTNFQVFYSAFVGRLFDYGVNGIAVLQQVKEMYRKLETPVSLLAASFRTYQQVVEALDLKPEIITLPLNYIQELVKKDFTLAQNQRVNYTNLKIPAVLKFETVVDSKDLNIDNEFVAIGLQKFSQDWKNMLQN